MRQKNFSISELFIAIIVGFIFLVALFALGNLISSAENKALIVQIGQYERGIELFIEKYHGLAGDLKQTELFKLSQVPTDGDGDNLITDSDKKIVKADGEIVNFWLHLTNSRLISEKFDGRKGENAKIGNTFPASKLGQNVGIVAFGADGKNYFQIGFAFASDEKIFMKDASLTSQEAEDFDKKIDDDDPSKGRVVTVGGTSLNSPENSKCKIKNSYDLKIVEPACQLRIELFTDF